MDDLDFERTVLVRLAGRFRPKVKPKSTKIASAAAITEFPNVVTENSIPVSSTVSDSDPSATSVDPVGSSSVTSETLGSLEPSGNNEHLYSSVLSFHGDRIIKPSESAAADSFQPLANGSDGSQSIFRKSASKNADELSGLECLEDCLTKSTNGAAPVSDNEKPVQKRKRTKKAPDEPTKKFSHSTCRNRRRADKSLTEMPEDEIDPKKIPLRDLIRLREYTERSEIKEAAKLKTPASNQKDRVGTSSFSLNYASFMEKPRPVKWSEQDTELFYEVIELFGTDFDMVALLFPGRTRNHIKFKHKKESRQNPLGIHQPKDSSRYAQLMNELLKVAQQMQKSNSDGLSDMEDLEEKEMTHDNNGEVTKPDKIEDMETDVADEVQYEEAAEAHSPMKSNQGDHGDGFSGWDDEF